MLKNIWGKISYYWFIIILAIISFFVGDQFVNADTLNYNNVDYRLFWYEFDGDDWVSGSNSYTAAGTSINVQNKGVWAWNTAIHLGSNTMVAGRTYKITMTYTMSPANNLLYRDYKNQIYWDNPVGSGNTNGSNASEDNIDRFSATYQPNCETCARNSVIYYVTPAVDIKYIQFRLRIKGNNMALTGYDPQISFNSVNQPAGDYIKITWTTDESAIAIQEQTEIIKEQTQIINNTINNLDDTMKDDSVDDPDSAFNDFENMLATNGTITNLILLPLTFYNSVVTNLNSSCQPFSLGDLYGTNLQMQCINIGQYLGNTLWNLIDLILSGSFVIIIARKMIKVFNNMSSMKEGDVIGD